MLMFILLIHMNLEHSRKFSESKMTFLGAQKQRKRLKRQNSDDEAPVSVQTPSRPFVCFYPNSYTGNVKSSPE